MSLFRALAPALNLALLIRRDFELQPLDFDLSYVSFSL